MCVCVCVCVCACLHEDETQGASSLTPKLTSNHYSAPNCHELNFDQLSKDEKKRGEESVW